MKREDLVNLRNKIKNKEVKMYSSAAAFEYIDDETIAENKFFFDFDLENIDQSAQVASEISRVIEQLMGKCSFIYDKFQSIDFLIVPKLFFDINTIEDKESPIIDNEGVEYEDKHVEINVVFVALIDGEHLEVKDLVLEGIVNYNNFCRIMNNFGFVLPYENFDSLVTNIMEAAKSEECPKFMISLDDEPKKKIK